VARICVGVIDRFSRYSSPAGLGLASRLGPFPIGNSGLDFIPSYSESHANYIFVFPFGIIILERSRFLGYDSSRTRELSRSGMNWSCRVSQEVGSFVRARRKAGNLTQRELGELAGVGTRFVSELERGKLSLRLDVMNRVLAVFGKCLGIADAPKKDEA
jgi:y4mF family transcriptional regulator